MSLFLALALYAEIINGCGTKEPLPEPTPTTVAVTGVSLDKTSLSLKEGSSETLTAKVSPDNASNKSVSWKSSATDVATVDGSGKVTAMKAGSATVTVTTADGSKTASCSVTVTEASVAVLSVSISPETAELEVGEKLTLTATVLPDNATDKTVTWESDNPSIVSVDQNGLVLGVTIGDATITAKAGEKSASCKLTITPTVAEMERQALIALYNSTGGDKWIHKDNWCSDKPVGEWYGVTTGANGQVESIELAQNNLTGEIPADIGWLKNLSFLSLEYNNLTGTIPESLYGLNHLSRIHLYSNSLSGELSEQFWSMLSLIELVLDDNGFTGCLTAAIRNASNLQFLHLASNNLTGTIPEEITDLKNLMGFSIGNSAIFNGGFTDSANNISGSIPENLDKLSKLRYFLASNNNLEGNVPACFARMPDLLDLKLSGNKLSGIIPEELSNCQNWDKWAPDVNIMPQQEGYTLSFSYYESTDFSKDGLVTKLQTHEKGNGINIIITGDCFTDREIASGAFDEVARQTMEDFFSIEPFTTFRNLFDVYEVVAVSKTNYHDYGTALGAVFGEGSYVGCDEEAVRKYSLMAVSNLDETLTIVIVNKDRNAGTAFMPTSPTLETDYGSGFSYACFGLYSQDPVYRSLINHEANGHGFTKLQDEYSYRGTTYPEEIKQNIKDTFFSKGYYANIDFESDPAKVKWAKLLSDERYKYDGLGVFEGGMTAEKGVWRPSENSVMGHAGGSDGDEGTRFNAPSRLAAYYRIHKLAYGSSWEFDYEEFVKYDAINRKTAPDN